MKPNIVIQTDFGVGGGGAMTGVMKQVDPELEVFQGNHAIEKFNVRAAARNLNQMVPFWPSGTVFVSVVDPGVGTARRASIAKLKNGSYVVSPDNGSFTLLLENPGIEEIRVIDETKNRYKGTEKVSIFHGRDLFGYCAAKLASGIIDFEGVGESYPVSEVVTYENLGYEAKEGYLFGYLTDMMQNFGNLETSIPLEAIDVAKFEVGEMVRLVIKHLDHEVVNIRLAYEPSFGWVKEGEPVLYNSSDGVLGIGINQGNFIKQYDLGFGKDWTLELSKEEGQ